VVTFARARILSLGAAAGLAALLSGVAGAQQRPSGPARPITGGTFEASGVAAVPNSTGVLFVDDNRTREIFWMELGPDGAQRGAVVAVPLGAEIEDPEGIAGDGSHFYVVGSQSKGQGPAGVGLVRFTFDAKSRRVERVQTMSRLKAWLVEQVPELEGIDAAVADEAFNIEGLAWDPAGARLLLGFRAPVADGEALIVALKLRDPGAAFAVENLQVDGRALRVPLGGAGIRGLDYDPRAQSLLIVAEPSGNRGSRGFSIVEWTPGASEVRPIATFDASSQPEGVARLPGSQAGTLVVFDTSRYAMVR
jgi:hypothetical protein